MKYALHLLASQSSTSRTLDPPAHHTARTLRRALRSQTVTRVLAQGLRVAVLGYMAGIVLALGLSRFLANMFYGMSALDPITCLSVVCHILLEQFEGHSGRFKVEGAFHNLELFTAHGHF
jgi:ABC-type nitrate/sulfonate/bicarbonate transport system permease component